MRYAQSPSVTLKSARKSKTASPQARTHHTTPHHPLRRPPPHTETDASTLHRAPTFLGKRCVGRRVRRWGRCCLIAALITIPLLLAQPRGRTCKTLLSSDMRGDASPHQPPAVASPGRSVPHSGLLEGPRGAFLLAQPLALALVRVLCAGLCEALKVKVDGL